MKKPCPKCTKLTSATYKYCYACNIENKSTDFIDDKSDDDIDKVQPYIKEKFQNVLGILFGVSTSKIKLLVYANAVRSRKFHMPAFIAVI